MISIRPATPKDASLIVQFVRDLAEYERDPKAAVATEEEWRSLCHAIERPALAADPRCQSARDRKIVEDEIEQGTFIFVGAPIG